MPTSTARSSLASVSRITLAIGVMAFTACSSRDKPVDATASGGAMASATGSASMANGASPMVGDTMSGMKSPKDMPGMQGMANMTGDADRDFLRMMSDHHKGLILLAHMTKEKNDVGTAAADAKKLDAAQDVELDKMMTMLEKKYKDAYAPKVIAEHQAMADALKPKSRKDYERTFYQDIITHHTEAIKMIDDYLPKSKSAPVKEMAGKMKADQSKEIRDFEQKVSKLGA